MKLTRPNSYNLAILAGLQDKPLYRGTVSKAVRDARRAASKAARISRRKNRNRR